MLEHGPDRGPGVLAQFVVQDQIDRAGAQQLEVVGVEIMTDVDEGVTPFARKAAMIARLAPPTE